MKFIKAFIKIVHEVRQRLATRRNKYPGTGS
jgi:hypothetical protein